ncbi:hypothetical protein H8356DRAFT_1275559 [Neocallimastix lanati (nom. inval.)]|uniref:Uncharacterized protein n=1 Tax=Neocallimastix californiae TaxID=1754190 RepID=A0A1Y2A7H7_9FUNG|nr:hypothetical protein H8356DRAFT_1275559 [Neocallimastix sp. JGI-2020a]ORY18267.1 hypothetical protein LY90DRAFT_517432 [Neocallimastix californiae]|eukprot:ORY18267.1 hypothetical protein LY90DRAFT_517432 [Neocallimastix californiae]
MGCGASKVTNQSLSISEKEITKDSTTKAIKNSVLTSSSSISQEILNKSKLDHSIDQEIGESSKNESTINIIKNSQKILSSNDKEQEAPLLLKTSSSSTINIEKQKSKLIRKTENSLEQIYKNNENSENEYQRTGSLKSSEPSTYYEKKENSLNSLMNNGNKKKGMSLSSSEETLTNQSSSDNVRKLLTSSFTPLPAIEQKTTLKSISFEIPLDESMICKTIKPNFKGSLPKLHISQDEIKRKIGNVDSKWKAISTTKGGYKKKGPADEEKLKALKKRLLEKEAEAAINRQKELDKLKAKLEKAQRHALKVQERKRKLEAEWISKSKSNLEMSSNINYIS